jgi:N-acetylmuramoyl-L-alanine amidase
VREFTRTLHALLGVLRLAAAATGCSERGASSLPEGGAALSESHDLGRALALASAPAALPPRAEVLALAESIEAQAVREGAGARAARLHGAAARLIERIWRVEGHERDATEAIELYRAASREPDAPGACDAALAGARLAGDAAHDASVTYAELYRVERRFGSARGDDAVAVAPGVVRPMCKRDLEESLSRLAAFRPPQRTLDAIDANLAGEGDLGPALPAAAGVPVLSPSKAPQLVRIESWPGRDAARVAVVLDRPAPYRIGDELLAGEGAPSIFLDLDGVDLGGATRDTSAQGIVTRVRAQTTSTGSRVSLDIAGRAWRRAFSMRDPYRIVIDVAHHPPGVTGRSPRAVARVVVDPGHGGKDNGAVGSSGVKEKDVTLDVARRLAPVLVTSGIQVVLTRDDDRFVSLEERTAIANGFGADLFVSIHCNASETRTRRGVETYVLDANRDELAARLAARENATSQAASAELASILGDLRLADQSQRSTRFARLLERAATSALGAKYGDAVDGGVHRAGFYVLVGADMPSVLLETSYISNATDEQRLDSDEYRQLLADAIANAIRAYREGR